MAATSRCVLTALAELHNKRYVYSSHTVLSLLQYLTQRAKMLLGVLCPIFLRRLLSIGSCGVRVKAGDGLDFRYHYCQP